ncbi:MAG: class I SAM-dependent methyltransferase [Alicyclobacillaceae bacterium]|nr:class I SAM-dependent methyltransferase [Alicyclobacillaceae bacterium]
MIDRWGRERIEFIADPVDFFDVLEQADWHRELQMTSLHMASLRDGDEALDIGCGAGWLGLYLAHRSDITYLADKSPRMVERARYNAQSCKIDNVRCLVADVFDLPFVDNKFTAIFCVNLLFTLPESEKAITEMMRVLKPGGRLILINPSQKMNAWTAMQYCHDQGITRLQRDTFVSLGAAAARSNPMMIRALENPQVQDAEIRQHFMLSGLINFVRIVKFDPEAVE